MEGPPSQSGGSLSSLLRKPPARKAECAPHSSCWLHLHAYQVTAYLEMPFVEVIYHLYGLNTVPDLSLRHLWSIPYPTGCIWKRKNAVTDGTDCQLPCGFLCPPRPCLWHWSPGSLVPDFRKVFLSLKILSPLSTQYEMVTSCLPALDIHSFRDRKCSLHLLQGLSKWHDQTSGDLVDIFQPTARSYVTIRNAQWGQLGFTPLWPQSSPLPFQGLIHIEFLIFWQNKSLHKLNTTTSFWNTITDLEQ